MMCLWSFKLRNRGIILQILIYLNLNLLNILYIIILYNKITVTSNYD